MDIKSSFLSCCKSDKIAVFIVYATLMVDNILLTAVVPILPEYFLEEELMGLDLNKTNTTAYESTTEQVTVMQDYSDDTEPCDNKYSKTLIRENLYLSFLIASKPLVQIIANMVVGPITDKVGFDVPMCFGYIIIIASSLGFAFGETYAVLFFSRALQGIGSACASTAGLGMLADLFRGEVERGKMLGLALGGLAMGVLVGPTFASVTYQFWGKNTPFLIIASITFIIFVIQLLFRRPRTLIKSDIQLKSSLKNLLRDPYILLAATALMLGNIGIGILETGQPIWMMMTMCADKWMLGIAFLPESISYLLSTLFFAWVSHRCGRWLICMSSFYVSTVACITIPFCKSLYELFGPGFLLGTAVGMVDATIFPILGNIADKRHTPVYGSVYAIADVSFCLAFVAGPLLAGSVIHAIGFNWLMAIVAIINFCFAPLVYFLRNVPSLNEENQRILQPRDSDEREINETKLSSP